MLEVWREREPLAEVLGILVGREPGPERRELEEDAARLAEVHGAEVEAVDDGRRMCACLRDAGAPGLVVVHRRGPGDVVHGSGALQAAPAGRLVVAVEPAATLAAHLPFVLAARREAEGLLEKWSAALRSRRVRADAVEALERVLARDLRMLGDERLVGNVDHEEFVPQSLGVVEGEAAVPFGLDALRAESVGPEIERIVRADAPLDRVDHPCAGAAGGRPRILEERD